MPIYRKFERHFVESRQGVFCEFLARGRVTPRTRRGVVRSKFSTVRSNRIIVSFVVRKEHRSVRVLRRGHIV
ncbi:hypothetical protein MTP99_006987 [Tenebrio molitor]|nr:hypothetical protein MTP99_006987 [Tenebrio molitor]